MRKYLEVVRITCTIVTTRSAAPVCPGGGSPDLDYMKQALALAYRALGTTSPNPAVGAVIVRDGEVVGGGFTLPPGQAHAEVAALLQAGERASGAAIYVTLEPCCVHGRTPPCTQAIISAGIAEAYVSMKDPNPNVMGRGLAELEAAGVRVHLGEDEEASKTLYEGFAKHIRTRLPFVTAKFAMSLDGKIATHTGDSRWITGEEARRRAHTIRKASDAILVGLHTVLKDDPRLTTRDDSGDPLPHQPSRVTFDSDARTPVEAKLLLEPGQTIVATTEIAAASTAADKEKSGRIDRLQKAGVEVVQLQSSLDGKVDPKLVLELLGARGVVNVLAEGGGTLLGSLFDAGLVDKVVAFIAPVIIGGDASPSPVEGTGSAAMSRVMRLTGVKIETVGDDILILGYPPQKSEG